MAEGSTRWKAAEGGKRQPMVTSGGRKLNKVAEGIIMELKVAGWDRK